MNSFQVGNKVQAVDELGRWTCARVVRTFNGDIFEKLYNINLCRPNNDGELEVNFQGWDSSYNRIVGPEEIRSIIDPSKEDYRKYILLFNIKFYAI